jgi:hypothetical protein
MLVKKSNNTTNYQKKPSSQNEKNYSILQFYFPTNHRFIYTMMPQMTSEEEGPLAEFSTARAFTQVQNIASKPLCRL